MHGPQLQLRHCSRAERASCIPDWKVRESFRTTERSMAAIGRGEPTMLLRGAFLVFDR
ncbi:hypothetical protein BH23GEM7_BH23GEM7_29560 [soil metagenome]